MEKVKLRNYKLEVIFPIASLALAGLLVYWGIKGGSILKISGARLDETTSSALFIIFAIFPFLTSINLFLKFISVLGYGEFVLVMTNDAIIYPEAKLFRGFKPLRIPRASIDHVLLADEGKNGFVIYLQDANGQALASIPAELAPYKTLKPKELAQLIQSWLNRTK